MKNNSKPFRIDKHTVRKSIMKRPPIKNKKASVWYDAGTGKHVRYGVAIAKKLRSSNYDVLLTTRDHPDTLSVASFLNEKFSVYGKYDPTSLLTRLESGVRRQLALCKAFENDSPDVAISHGSVNASRIAF